MREVLADTSAIQYLHQLGLLDLLRALYGRVTVPGAVADEIDRGRASGLDLPDLGALPWIAVERRAVPPPAGLDPGSAGESAASSRLRKADTTRS